MLSMCDRLWHPDMTEDQALALMEKGIAEVTPQFPTLLSHTISQFTQQCAVFTKRHGLCLEMPFLHRKADSIVSPRPKQHCNLLKVLLASSDYQGTLFLGRTYR